MVGPVGWAVKFRLVVHIKIHACGHLVGLI